MVFRSVLSYRIVTWLLLVQTFGFSLCGSRLHEIFCRDGKPESSGGPCCCVVCEHRHHPPTLPSSDRSGTEGGFARCSQHNADSCPLCIFDTILRQVVILHVPSFVGTERITVWYSAGSWDVSSVPATIHRIRGPPSLPVHMV